RGIADIAGKSDRLTAFRLDELDDLFCIGFLGGIVRDRDIGAFAGIGNGGRAAHAGVTAGDEGLAALQAARSLVAFLAMVGAGIHFAGEAGPFLGLAREGWFGIFRRGVG